MKPRLGTVLVPTDFSEPSLQALDYAAALLKIFEGGLHLVHVQEPEYNYAAPSLLEATPLVSTGEMERHNRARLGKLRAKYAGSEATPPCHASTGRALTKSAKWRRGSGRTSS